MKIQEETNKLVQFNKLGNFHNQTFRLMSEMIAEIGYKIQILKLKNRYVLKEISEITK
jgi:hypothetical protein